MYTITRNGKAVIGITDLATAQATLDDYINEFPRGDWDMTSTLPVGAWS